VETVENIPGLGRIGMGSWTYPWAIGTIRDHPPKQPMSPSALVRRAAELGVTVVQILDNLPLDRLTVAELKDLRKLALHYGIELQVGTRGIERSHLLHYLEIAQQLEARLVRTMGGWPGQPAPLAEIEKEIQAVLPEFTGAGVSLALENYEAYSTGGLAHLVDMISHPKLGICLDLTNSFGALESAEQMLNNLAPLTINLHLKEFTVERLDHLMGFAFLGRPTGKGMLPLEQIFTRLAQFGRRPDVIVELWTPFTKTLEDTLALEHVWAAESIAYLRTIANSPSPIAHRQ
jgi:sugar phosphate isomerase/epimerase